MTWAAVVGFDPGPQAWTSVFLASEEEVGAGVWKDRHQIASPQRRLETDSTLTRN